MTSEEYRFRDDFMERSPYWKWRIDNFASINVKDSILEMSMGPTEALYYSNAEISDGTFDDLPWIRGVFEVKLMFTGLHYGSAGFGFWNHSMRTDLSNPVWFIYLRAAGPYPLQGFFAQMANKFQPIMLFKSVGKYKIALDILPFLAPIKINSREPVMQDIDFTKWNVFRVEWFNESSTFYINEVEVAKLRSNRRSRARADIWIDNAVFYPPWRDAGSVFRHITQENRVKTCLKIDYVEINGFKVKL
jgi:hypothetical protein